MTVKEYLEDVKDIKVLEESKYGVSWVVEYNNLTYKIENCYTSMKAKYKLFDANNKMLLCGAYIEKIANTIKTLAKVSA